MYHLQIVCIIRQCDGLGGAVIVGIFHLKEYILYKVIICIICIYKICWLDIILSNSIMSLNGQTQNCGIGTKVESPDLAIITSASQAGLKGIRKLPAPMA